MSQSNNNIQSNEHALKSLLLDISCLDKLNPWTSKVNLFEVLKISRTEIRHSNILAWLLDANENHGLNDLFIRGVIHKVVENNRDYFERQKINVLELLTVDYSHFTVYRELNNIDILLVSNTDQLVICIENKIGTGEHDNQLEKYRAKVESDYLKSNGYDHIYIYLTPDNAESSDLNNWLSFSYSDILFILDSIIKTAEVEQRALIIIESYIETIRRFVVKDKDLEKICIDIYKKHKQALDLIYENRPDASSIVASILNDYLFERASNVKDIVFNQNKFNSSKSIKRFSLESFDRIFPPIPNAQGYWGDGINYFWEVKNFCMYGKINIVFVMCNYEQLNSGKAGRLAKALDAKLNDNWQWKTFKSFNIELAEKNQIDQFLELDYDEMKKAIFPKLERTMEKVHTFEKEVLEIWNA